MSHSDKALELFYSGYNCSQSVFAAFCDITGLSLSAALRMSQGLGGGVGRLRQTCGAFTGAVLVISMLYGSDKPGNDAKKALYERVQALGADFKAKYGTFSCRELLGEEATDKPLPPQERTPEFYATRPCTKIIEYAAHILDEYINKNEAVD